MKQNITAPIWKGFLIGATMIVPGISGGTMAMIFPGWPKGWETIVSMISAVAGFFVVYRNSSI